MLLALSLQPRPSLSHEDGMSDANIGSRIAQSIMLARQMQDQKRAQQVLGRGMLLGIGTQPGGPDKQYFGQPAPGQYGPQPQPQSPGQQSTPMQQPGGMGKLPGGSVPDMVQGGGGGGGGQIGDMGGNRLGSFDPRQQLVYDATTKEGIHNWMRNFVKEQGWAPEEAERDFDKMVRYEMEPNGRVGGRPGDYDRFGNPTSFGANQLHIGGLGSVYERETGARITSMDTPQKQFDALAWSMRKAHVDPSILNQWFGWQNHKGIKGPDMRTPGGAAVADQASRRQLDWTVLARAIRDANPNIKPEDLAAAVNMGLPMMNQGSQAEWREVQAALREQHALTEEGRLQEQERHNVAGEADRAERTNQARERLDLARIKRQDSVDKVAQAQKNFELSHGDANAWKAVQEAMKQARRDQDAYDRAMTRANAAVGDEDVQKQSKEDAARLRKSLDDDLKAIDELPMPTGGKGGQTGGGQQGAPGKAYHPFVRKSGGIDEDNKALKVHDQRAKDLIKKLKKVATDEEINKALKEEGYQPLP
jgi:hypothetical protein